MRTRDSHAKSTDVAIPSPFASANVLLAAYGDMLGAAFGIMHELTVEAMTLTHRAAEFWLTQGEQYRAELGTIVPWTPLIATGTVAGVEAGAYATSPPHEVRADAHDDDDDPCCGEACTSKSCKRMLKSLEFAVSDFH
jgi:hypothetical protein